MEVATYLLLLLGICGAIDIVLYHSAAHGIRSHPDSRQELIVHSLRGPTYAALFLLIPNFALQGVFFYLLLGLFALDVGISLWDFAIERGSRAFFGGLPSGEYVLHMVIAMLFGALVTSVCLSVGAWARLPSAIVYAPADVPGWLRAVMAVMSLVVLYSGLLDLVAACRLSKQARRATAQT